MPLRFPLLAALVVALGVAPAQAQDNCTSAASGNFSAPATWTNCGGGAPGADDQATITGGTTVTLDADATILGLVIDGGGTFNNGSATLTAAKANDAFLTNNGAFQGASGTFVFAQNGGVFGSSVTAFNNVTIRGGVEFGASGAPQSTVSGVFAIEAGGFVRDADGGGARTATYLPGSTLRYDTGGQYGRGAEWTTSASPANVAVAGGTTLTLGTPGGTLSTGGLIVNGALDMGSMANPLDVNGGLNLSGGVLSLSSAIGGDLLFGGSTFRVSGGGALNANNRAVTFDSPQTAGAPIYITGAVAFDFLTINTARLDVAALNAAVTINRGLTLTSGQLYLAGTGTLATSAPSGLTGSTASATVTGDAGWRLLSAPAASLSTAELDDDGAATQLNPANILTGYDGSAFTTPSSLPATLDAARGFFLYFYDNDRFGSQPLPLALDIDGADPGVADDPRVSGLNRGAGNDGSNMVGNPFRNAFDVTRLVGVGAPAPQSADSVACPLSGTSAMSGGSRSM